MTLNPKEYNHWIDKHLRGELTGQDKIGFERMLKDDIGLASKVEEMKEIQAGIRQSVLEEKYALMEEWDDELVGDAGIVFPTAEMEKNNLLLVWLGAAATFVLATIFLWPMNETEKIKPNAKFGYLLDNPDTFNKIANPIALQNFSQDKVLNNRQKEAYNLFSAHKFYDATPLLEKLWIIDEDSTALYYLGHSYLWTNKEKRGLDILLKRFKDSKSYYINERLSK